MIGVVTGRSRDIDDAQWKTAGARLNDALRSLKRYPFALEGLGGTKC